MTFSNRLREERARLKLNQTDFAAAGGVTKKSQVAYENDAEPAFVRYLEEIARIGVDIGYLFTGQRSRELVLTPEQRALIAQWEVAAPALRAAAMAVLVSGQASTVKMYISGVTTTVVSMWDSPKKSPVKTGHVNLFFINAILV